MSDTWYVGRDPECGHITWTICNESVAVLGDWNGTPKYRREVAKTVADMVKKGLAVSLVEHKVIANEGMCKCVRRRHRDPR